MCLLSCGAGVGVRIGIVFMSIACFVQKLSRFEVWSLLLIISENIYFNNFYLLSVFLLLHCSRAQDDGYRYIIHMRDHFTKFSWARATKQKRQRV